MMSRRVLPLTDKRRSPGRISSRAAMLPGPMEATIPPCGLFLVLRPTGILGRIRAVDGSLDAVVVADVVVLVVALGVVLSDVTQAQRDAAGFRPEAPDDG